MDTESVDHADGFGQVRSRRLFDVVRDVVEDVAPEELPLLTGLRRFNEAKIGRQLAHGAKRDDPLGFGTGEIVVLVTPIVWGAVQHVANQAAGSALHRLLARARALFRRILHREQPAAILRPFSREELQEVRSAVLDKAREVGMRQARAEQLADSVVGRLTLNDTSHDDT